MTVAMLRARWRGLALRGALFALGLCAVSATVEHLIEVREAARLTANDTFYATHGRRIRYHLTGKDNSGPTVVLLGGITASLEQWEGLQTVLSGVSPVISYDRGGAGFSDPADAQDATAEADELYQLLRSDKFLGPFVLVSFSSSSMMATVVAAKHPDIIKGIVFVDPAPVGLPALPAPGTKTYRRTFWRLNVIALQAFLGLTRFRSGMEASGAPEASPLQQRDDEILKSAHHWFASAHEAMSLDESAEEAASAMETHPFARMPLGVLTALDPGESEYIRDVFERHEKLAASSKTGIIRRVHFEHSQLLNNPTAISAIVDLTHTIIDEVRSKAAVGMGSSAQ